MGRRSHWEDTPADDMLGEKSAGIRRCSGAAHDIARAALKCKAFAEYVPADLGGGCERQYRGWGKQQRMSQMAGYATMGGMATGVGGVKSRLRLGTEESA
jgi:hypothetical protein